MDSDLFNHLQKLALDEKLGTAELQKYTYQLLRGLEAIHRAGVLHRDLVRSATVRSGVGRGRAKR